MLRSLPFACEVACRRGSEKVMGDCLPHIFEVLGTLVDRGTLTSSFCSFETSNDHQKRDSFCHDMYHRTAHARIGNCIGNLWCSVHRGRSDRESCCQMYCTWCHCVASATVSLGWFGSVKTYFEIYEDIYCPGIKKQAIKCVHRYLACQR